MIHIILIYYYSILQNLSQLDNPFVVQFITSFDNADRIIIVMQMCSGGDLYERIKVSDIFFSIYECLSSSSDPFHINRLKIV